jgi:hypothetical protein
MKTVIIHFIFLLCSQLLSQIDTGDKINHHSLIQKAIEENSNLYHPNRDPFGTIKSQIHKVDKFAKNQVPNNNYLLAEKLQQRWSSSAWWNDTKHSYTYDGNNNLIADFESAAIGTNWDNKFKIVYSYDSRNNRVDEVLQDWFWPIADWDNVHHYKYTSYVNNNLKDITYQIASNSDQWENIWTSRDSYDANNNRIERFRQNWVGEVWLNDSKTNYKFDENNNMVLEEYQTWNSSIADWVNVWAYERTFDGNNNMVESLYQEWDGEYWLNNHRFVMSYDENNNNTDYLYQELVGYNWIDKYLIQYTFNENNKFTTVVRKNMLNSQWTNDWKNFYSYDENNNRIEQVIMDWAGSTWTNDVRFTYSYQSATVIKQIPDKNFSYSLSENYPNPFNPTTTIKYAIPKRSYVTLEIFDVLSRNVSTLLAKEQQQGEYEIKFDASHLANGVYFYSLRAGDFVDTRKMIVIK